MWMPGHQAYLSSPGWRPKGTALMEPHSRGRKSWTLATVAVVLFATAAYLGLTGPGPSSSSATASVETMAPPGLACSSSSIPAGALQAEADPMFANASQGLCYNYTGETTVSESASSTLTRYTFDLYNGTVFYPCGLEPQELVVSEIQADVVTGGQGGSVQGIVYSNDTGSLDAAGNCGTLQSPVLVVSARLVEVTIPAVLEFNVTLRANPAGTPVTNLRAVLELPDGNQTVQFKEVSATDTLKPGGEASQVSIITGVPSIVVGGVYNMAIEGSLQGGQSFGYTAQIALVT